VSALLASVDGAIGPAAQATISVTDEGLLRGDGAFEMMKLYGGRPFALEDHYARLQRTCEGLRLPLELDTLRGEVDALLEAHGDADALLRLVLTRGGRRIALVETMPEVPASQTVATVTYTPTRVLDTLKTLSYAANMTATRIAKRDGADEALLVTPDGTVLEAPTSTIFWVGDDGVLATPPLDDHILASITRDKLLELVDAQERPLTTEELLRAREAFLASTVREVQSVAAVEDREFPETGEVTRKAAAAFRAYVDSELS
jgi:branched-chain amino acid aminotransferase